MFKRTILLVTAFFALTAGSALAERPAKDRPAKGSDRPAKGPFAGTVHAVGNITYRDASQQTWSWDRGTITAVDSTSITLTRRDKAQVSLAITPSTVVRNKGASYQLSDLRTGLAATVVSQNGNALIIRNIRGDGAPGGADQSAIEGPGAKAVTGTIDATYVDGSTQSFDFNRGRITALGEGTLSIKRADGQTVTFTFDASTVVKRNSHFTSIVRLRVGQGATFFSQNGALKLVRGVVQPKRIHPPRGHRAPGAAPADAPAAA